MGSHPPSLWKRHGHRRRRVATRSEVRARRHYIARPSPAGAPRRSAAGWPPASYAGPRLRGSRQFFRGVPTRGPDDGKIGLRPGRRPEQRRFDVRDKVRRARFVALSIHAANHGQKGCSTWPDHPGRYIPAAGRRSNFTVLQPADRIRPARWVTRHITPRLDWGPGHRTWVLLKSCGRPAGVRCGRWTRETSLADIDWPRDIIVLTNGQDTRAELTTQFRRGARARAEGFACHWFGFKPRRSSGARAFARDTGGQQITVPPIPPAGQPSSTSRARLHAQHLLFLLVVRLTASHTTLRSASSGWAWWFTRARHGGATKMMYRAWPGLCLTAVLRCGRPAVPAAARSRCQSRGHVAAKDGRGSRLTADRQCSRRRRLARWSRWLPGARPRSDRLVLI